MKATKKHSPSARHQNRNAAPFFQQKVRETASVQHGEKENQQSSDSDRIHIQAKLTLGHPNDPYEREADAMAQKVVERQPANKKEADLPEHQAPQVQAKMPLRDYGEGFVDDEDQVHEDPIQLKEETGTPSLEKVDAIRLQTIRDYPEGFVNDEDQTLEDPVQLKNDSETGSESEFVQPETVGVLRENAIQSKPFDRREAGTRLVPLPQIQLEKSELAEEAEPELQTMEGEREYTSSPETPPDDTAQDPPDVQKNEAGRTYGLPRPGLETRLNQSKGGGNALPEEVQTEMGDAFQADLSNIRIHTDQAAIEMSQELGAQAFTNGADIYFNKDKYDPEGLAGKKLLAHEITHTQQQGAILQRKPDVQLEEELDLVQMMKDLLESNREQQAALDPSEANETRKDAASEGKNAEVAANAEVPEIEPVEPEMPAADVVDEGPRIAEPTPQKPDKVVPRATAVTIESEQVEEPLEKKEAEPESVESGLVAAAAPEDGGEELEKGPVGKSLDQQSAEVCNKGAEKAQTLADNESAHDTAAEKAAQTELAVEPPTEEGQSRSNAEQVKALEQADTPEANTQDTRREMDEAISRAVPAKIKELNEFESQKKAQVIGNKVLADTSRQVGEVQGTYNEIEKAPPAAESETAVPIPQIEQAPKTPGLNLGKGAVPDLKPEQTDLSEFKNEADSIYEKEGVTPEMKAEFDQVDSGDIAEANKEKGILAEKVENEPARLQDFAKSAQKGVEKDLQEEEGRARGEMEKKRQKELDGAQQKQAATKTELEKKREAVTNWINGRYEKAQKVVKDRLQHLEKNALASFDAGQKRLSIQFELNVKRRVNRWKDKRYSGFWGAAKWVKDKFYGIDHFTEIKNIFSTERAAFVAGIDKLIVSITRENEGVIQSCKAELATAKREIQEYIDQLGPDLKKTGEKAQAETDKKLAELDAHIEKEKKKLQQKLCDAKEAAIKAIDQKIEQMKSEMSGIVGKLKALLLYAAKKFFKWVIGKIGGSANKIIGILDKGATVLKKVFTDPIGFFKNLGRAVGGGIGRFVTNIVTWLKKGLMGWLMGAMGDSGLELPEKFNLKGILFLGLQVAGLTWNMIRARLVKKLGPKGETIVGTAEKAISIFQRVRQEGPIALWHIIVDKAKDIKAQVMGAIRNWAITKIIKKATVKLISMLNPAGAIFQAIVLLYDTVMFFIENWERIADFVNSVFDSIGSIASGAIGQAANFIEQTLGKTVPIIISFFARFVGLDGIGKAIKRVIQAIQKPFKKILGKIIGFLVKQVKKVFKGGKKLASKAKDVVGRIRAWLKLKKSFKDKSGASHSLFFEESGNDLRLMIASRKETFLKFINRITIDKNNPKHVKALDESKVIARKIDKLIKKRKSTKRDTKGTKDQTTRMTELLEELGTAISVFTIGDSKTLPASANPKFGGLRSGFGTSMSINPLTRIGPPGKTPRVDNKAWQTLKQRRQTKGGRSYYVRGHLLNEYMHGTGTDWRNFAIITQQANKDHLVEVEDVIYQQIMNNDYVAEYSMSVNYGIRPGPHIDEIKEEIAQLNANQGKKRNRLKKILTIMEKESMVASSLSYDYKIYDLSKKKVDSKSGRIKSDVGLGESDYFFSK